MRESDLRTLITNVIRSFGGAGVPITGLGVPQRSVCGDRCAQQPVSDILAPPMDVLYNETTIEVYVDVPGMDPAGLVVELKEGELWIGGVRTLPYDAATAKVSERKSGEMCRVLTLGEVVDPAGDVLAECTNGVLKVTLQKTKPAIGRRIEVNGVWRT